MNVAVLARAARRHRVARRGRLMAAALVVASLACTATAGADDAKKAAPPGAPGADGVAAPAPPAPKATTVLPAPDAKKAAESAASKALAEAAKPAAAPSAAPPAPAPAAASATPAASSEAPAPPPVATPAAAPAAAPPAVPKATAPGKVAAPTPKASATKPAVPATPPPPARTNSPDAEAVWKAYEKRWSETADYAAQFRQVIEVPDIGSRVESAGRFYFAKPGLVRWEYTEGPPQTVVGDGKWIWVWQPDLEQVYKIDYARAFGRGGLVELLAGREGVAERYRATLDRPDTSTVRIHLEAVAEGGGDLDVTLSADTFDLRAVTVHDAAGSITQMTFAQPLRNKGVEADRFTFTPPPGVDIISESDAGF